MTDTSGPNLRANDPHSRQPVHFDCLIYEGLSELTWWGSRLFTEPVRVAGSAVFNGDYYDVSYTMHGIMHMTCSRCLEDICVPLEKSFSRIAMEADDSISPWGDTILLDDGNLDVAAMASADLLLEMEGVFLCRDDCPGLCPVCGKHKDLSCGCDPNPPDPRFDALRELLNKDNDE